MHELHDREISDEVIDAIAQAIITKLQTQPEPNDEAPVLVIQNYPRYQGLSWARVGLSGLAGGLLPYTLVNCFVPLLPEASVIAQFGLAGLAIGGGLMLIILLVVELFQGAGVDQEIQRTQGSRIDKDYQFIPSLDRFLVVLGLLVLGLLSIILGFANLYTELVRQNPAHFIGLEPGFLAIYFSLVTFSTVGYGDIYPVSVVARLTAVGEIFMAMFFSLVVISSTLSWVIAHKRQQQELTIQERVLQAQSQTQHQEQQKDAIAAD